MVFVIDSDMTFEDSVRGSKAPKEVIDELVLLDVKYYGIDGKIHQGQIMVNKGIEQDTIEIFEFMLDNKFPIEKCVPMVNYDWDDDLSMADNNSSAFCYRVIAGTDRISKHSFGYAIDINPKFNPLITKSGNNIPPVGNYDISRAGTLVEGSKVVKKFLDKGFTWGKCFSAYEDIHHFEKMPK